MSTEPRRSSRTNKGTHTGRNLLEIYYKPEEDEPQQKRQKLDGDFTPEQAERPNGEADDQDNQDNFIQPEKGQEGDVRCDPCHTTQENYNEETDNGGMMIECDGCATWQHAACMGYKTKRLIPEQYLCNRCAPKSLLKATPEKPAKVVKAAKAVKAAPVNKTRLSVSNALANVVAKAHGADVEAQKWANEMEQAIHAWSGTTDKKYIDKSRSVMALVKKLLVFQRLVSGELSAKDLVVLPPEEIDSELKDYAEKVRQELIRRSVLTVEDELSQRIRRTHKGEEIVENNTNEEEVNLNIAARNIDHRVFRETTPVRESVISGLLSGPNLYQIGDDDDDEVKEEKEGKEESETNGGDEKGNDSDDELDFILGSKSPQNAAADAVAKSPPKPAAQPKLPPTMSNRFWSGELVFPDFVLFSAQAEFVGCTNYEKPKDVTTASFHNRAIRVCKELLEKPRYSIEGRLDRNRADPYVDKITSSRDLYVVKIESPETANYDKLLDYLYSRSKVGVLSGRAACVKDAYLYALDNDAPGFLNVGPISRGLYAVFVVKKDYIPVGKSILKKSVAPQPAPAPSLDLDSILSKLAETPAGPIPNLHYPQPQVPQNMPQDYLTAPQLPLELTPEQLQYLSELVSQNPHVQQNPQALLSLLQGNQVPGYH